MLDAVIQEADVVTLDDGQPQAVGLGILGGRIAAVFRSERDLADVAARNVIDAGGATLIPGFNDAHCHTAWYGLGLEEIPAGNLSSLDELYTGIAAKAAEAPAGEWVVATGYNHLDLGNAYPELEVLDRIAPQNPVLIRHRSGHACIVNTQALTLAGFLAPGYTESEGEVAVRDAHGRFTGLLEERAQSRVQALLLPRSQADLVRGIGRATREYAALGITSFTEAGIGSGWIGHSTLEISAYQLARAQGALHARAQLMVSIDSLHPVQGHSSDPHRIGLDLGIRTGFGDDVLSIGPTKVFIDGSLFGRTAALKQPYATSSDGNSGYLQDTEAALAERILGAAASGWSVAAHGIGDAAIDFAIDVFATATKVHGRPAVPHRIEHGGVISDEQLKQLAKLGVVIVPQPGFIREFGAGMRELLGPARTEQAYRAKSLLSSGMVLPGSSDSPVASNHPLANIRSFVERLADDGELFGESERLTSLEALRAYTVGSAQATGFGHSKGAFRVGMLADCVMLDKNPLSGPVEEIDSASVLRTFVGGEEVVGQ